MAPAKNVLTRKGALVAITALALLALSGVHSRSQHGNLRGYPWSFTTAVSPCDEPNPFNGCGSTIAPLGASLDFVFWILVSLAIVSGTEVLFRRLYFHSSR